METVITKLIESSIGNEDKIMLKTQKHLNHRLPIPQIKTFFSQCGSKLFTTISIVAILPIK